MHKHCLSPSWVYICKKIAFLFIFIILQVMGIFWIFMKFSQTVDLEFLPGKMFDFSQEMIVVRLRKERNYIVDDSSIFRSNKNRRKLRLITFSRFQIYYTDSFQKLFTWKCFIILTQLSDDNCEIIGCTIY